jgi:peptidyl-prolyl cis-trans isomerase D
MMLEKMRAHAQGVVARVLVGAIIVVLALFGFGSFNLFTPDEPAVAEVAGEEIGESALQAEMERQRRQRADVDEAALRDSALDALIQRRLLLSAADAMSVAVGDASLAEAIRKQPEFQVEGRFSEDTYRAVLAQNGFTPKTFGDFWREQLLIMRLQRGIAESDFVTDPELARVTALTEQKRDLQWIAFAPAPDTVLVGDGDLEAYFEANQAAFTVPEQATVEYVRISPADIADDALPVTDAEVEAAYAAASAAALSELRIARHILLPLPDSGDGTAAVTAATERLAALAARVRAGESFEALAREHSTDLATKAEGGLLPPLSRGALSGDDPGFAPLEAALFALAPGGMAEPVRSPQGMHLLRLEEVRSQPFPSLDEKRDQLVAELRAARRSAEFAKRRDTLAEEAYADAGSLSGVADRLGVHVVKLEGVRRDGLGDGIAANAAFVAAVFSDPVLQERFNSQVIDVEGDAVVVRVSDHQPQRQETLDEARDRVLAAFRAQEASAAAEASARGLLARIEAGEDPLAAAGSLARTWETRKGVARLGGDVPPEVLTRAFALARPAPGATSGGVAALADGGRAVVLVSGVTDGDGSALAAAERASLAGYLRSFGGQRTFAAFVDALRAAAHIERTGTPAGS